MIIPPGKKIFFLSDFHLGVPNAAASLEREKLIVRFLDEKQHEAAAFFLMGDMFDFWYEYRKVVPRGYTRIFGKLASLTDSGIPVHFFVGNHDMWMQDYFQQELNIPIYFEPREFTFGNKHFYIGHGDGLGPGDGGYKALKKVFRNPVCQALFGLVPPRIGIGLADYFSEKSRAKSGGEEEVWLGEDKEWLIIYCKEMLQQKPVDFFVFGHRHLPIDWKLSPAPQGGIVASTQPLLAGEATKKIDSSQSGPAQPQPTPPLGGGGARYINLGDWIRYCTYAEFDGNDIRLLSFTGRDEKIIRNW